MVTKKIAYLIYAFVFKIMSDWFLGDVNAQSETLGHENKNISPSKTALLIVDIQNDYFKDGKFALAGSAVASLNAKKVLNAFRKKDLPIIHIQHESNKENATFFAPNSHGQKIHRNVLPLSGETVFTKHQVSSFEQTPLLNHLRKENIQRLVITGMQTNVCVFGAVKDGLKNEFEIIVLKDATAAVTSEKHNDTLSLIKTEGAEIMTTDDFIAAMVK